MSMHTAPDIPLLVTVPGPSSTKPLVSAERRINPSWTVELLKGKLEPVTGIPAGCMVLKVKGPDGGLVEMADGGLVGEGAWSVGIRRGGEIEVHDTRPPSARTNFTDVSSVEKYEMPESQYEQLTDSVLAWKKRQRLGRFDPSTKSAGEMEGERRLRDEAEVKKRGVEVGERCRVGQDDGRRGVVRFVGEIVGLGGEKEAGCVWVGVELDEPVGKNDGTVKVLSPETGKEQTRKLFECKEKFGVLVRPEKVEVGSQWEVLDDLMGSDMEEI